MTGKKANSILILLLLFSMLSACTEEEEEFGSIDSITDPDGDITGVESNAFYVDMITTGWSGQLHKTSGVNEECKISTTATAQTDKYIDCLFDVPETSAHHQDLQLQINVPANMCRYVVFDPYHFYNWPSGTGPAEIWVQSNVDSGGTFVSYSCSEVSGNQGDMGTCDFSEWALDDGSPVCSYDHSQTNSSFPNCCEGSARLNTQTHDGATSSDITAVNHKWGDSYDPQCIGGPATSHPEWPGGIDTQNFPGAVIYDTWNNGLKETYDFSQPNSLSRDGDSNVHLYNYYAGVIPNQLSPAFTDLSGDALRDVQENYEFNCLDENSEVLFSIDLKLREWNTSVEYDNFLTGALANPDVIGVEGTDCAYDSPVSLRCNDYADWDDLVGLGNLFPALLWQGVSAANF